jgi:hypothetical protein
VTQLVGATRLHGSIGSGTRWHRNALASCTLYSRHPCVSVTDTVVTAARPFHCVCVGYILGYLPRSAQPGRPTEPRQTPRSRRETGAAISASLPRCFRRTHGPALFSWWPKRQCGLRPTMTPAGGGEPATARRRAATEERKTGGKASSAHYRQTATSRIRVLYIRTKVQCTRTASARVRGPRQRRLSIGARVLGATCPSQNSQSTAAPAMMVLG